MASTWGKNWWMYALGIVAAICGTFLVLHLLSDRSIVPLPDELARIRALSYDVETMNCQHKAGLYATALKKAGYTCWVAIGRVNGKGHAWVVFLDKNGNRRLVDPSGLIGSPSGYLESSYDMYKADLYVDEQWSPTNEE